MRVVDFEKLISLVQCWLEVYSKSLRQVQQAKQRAQRQADNEVRKP